MSNKPSPTPVAALRAAAMKLRSLDKEADRLRDVISTSEKQLRAATEARAVHARDIVKILENMDCKFPGNTGWEERVVWMFGELADQFSAPPPFSVPSGLPMPNPPWVKPGYEA